jgi:hypothetical protein
MKETIKNMPCPKCGTNINIDDLLHQKIKESLQKQYDAKEVEQKQVLKNESDRLKKEAHLIQEERKNLQETVAIEVKSRMANETRKMLEKVRKQITDEKDEEITAYKLELQKKSNEVKSNNRIKAELEKTKREMEEMEGRLKVENEEKLSKAIARQRDLITKEVEGREQLKIAEKDMKLEALNCTLTDTNGFYQALSVRDSVNRDIGVLIRFNYQGDTLWQTKFIGDSLERVYLNALSMSKDGGFLMTGVVVNFGPAQTTRLLLLKANALGHELWRKKISKPVPDVQQGFGILEDTASKRIITTGYQFIGGATYSDTYGNVIIFDSLGNKLFQNSYNNASGSGLVGPIKLKDNNFLAWGSWFSYETAAGATYYRAFVVKFDIDGKVIWKKIYPDIARYNNIHHVFEKTNGDLVLIGKSDTNKLSLAMNFYIADHLGNIYLQRKFDADEKLVTYRSINKTMDQGYLISRAFIYNSNSFGFIKIDSSGCDTTEAYCKSLEVGLNDFDVEGNEFGLYPNPANESVTLKFGGPENKRYNVEIADITGQQALSLMIEANDEKKIGTSSLTPGIYFVTIFSQGRTFQTRKLVISR